MVTPDYAADLTVLILDRDRNAKIDLTYNLNIYVTMQQVPLQKVQIMSNGGSLYFFTKISY